MTNEFLDRWFRDHPDAVGETYGRHLVAALGFAGVLLAAALQCFVHALVPGLFERSASRKVERLLSMMRRAPPPTRAVDGVIPHPAP